MKSEPFSLPGWRGELNAAFPLLDLPAEVARLIDPGAALKTLHWGRNYLYVTRIATEAGPLEVVVKQFRHQSLRDRLRRRFKGSKAERSWRAARALLDGGLATPEPVLLIESAREEGPAFYACRYLPDHGEARYLFRAAAEGSEAEKFPEADFPAFVAGIGCFARRLHDAGFWHRDLSGGNLLLRFGADGAPESIQLLDLNRMRSGKEPSLSERMRDLSRLALFRPEHQELLLRSYWGDGGSVESSEPRGQSLYLSYHRAFLWKNESKKRLRAFTGGLKKALLPRPPHAHIPEAPQGASSRDRIVWDHLSDQPHQHAGRLEKLRVRAADLGAHLREGAVVAAALPRILRRNRALKAGLYRQPVPWDGVGICLRPWPENPEAPLALLDELGAQHVFLRLHPWEDDHEAEEAIARGAFERGCEVSFALPQNRDLVRDPARWRAKVEELAARFTPYGRHFQIGQAINRSKWGIWSVPEYLALARAAEEVLRRYPGVEILGPSVIDFEYHVAAAVLNLRSAGVRFDAVSALLYVDRRGAPENRQAGLDTVDKVVLLRAIAETAKNAGPRCWITEVNWPLREGPHSPAGRAVSVGEGNQADYLVRYYLLALGTGLVERVFWWQVVARGYGLVDPADPTNPRRRPSFFALKTLLAQLRGATFLGPLPAPEPARLYRFRRPDGAEVVVGWSATNQPAEAVLPRRAVAVVGRDGEELAAAGTESAARASPAFRFLRGDHPEAGASVPRSFPPDRERRTGKETRSPPDGSRLPWKALTRPRAETLRPGEAEPRPQEEPGNPGEREARPGEERLVSRSCTLLPRGGNAPPSVFAFPPRGRVSRSEAFASHRHGVALPSKVFVSHRKGGALPSKVFVCPPSVVVLPPQGRSVATEGFCGPSAGGRVSTLVSCVASRARSAASPSGTLSSHALRRASPAVCVAFLGRSVASRAQRRISSGFRGRGLGGRRALSGARACLQPGRGLAPRGVRFPLPSGPSPLRAVNPNGALVAPPRQRVSTPDVTPGRQR